MPAVVLVGAQWGDEGKGKATDTLGSRVDYVVMFTGRNTAGHTVVLGTEKYALALPPGRVLPAGVTPGRGSGVFHGGGHSWLDGVRRWRRRTWRGGRLDEIRRDTTSEAAGERARQRRGFRFQLIEGVSPCWMHAPPRTPKEGRPDPRRARPEH